MGAGSNLHTSLSVNVKTGLKFNVEGLNPPASFSQCPNKFKFNGGGFIRSHLSADVVTILKFSGEGSNPHISLTVQSPNKFRARLEVNSTQKRITLNHTTIY